MKEIKLNRDSNPCLPDTKFVAHQYQLCYEATCLDRGKLKKYLKSSGYRHAIQYRGYHVIHVVHKEKQHVNNIEDTDIIYNMLNNVSIQSLIFSQFFKNILTCRKTKKIKIILLNSMINFIKYMRNERLFSLFYLFQFPSERWSKLENFKLFVDATN